jgi:hypothetical protein
VGAQRVRNGNDPSYTDTAVTNAVYNNVVRAVTTWEASPEGGPATDPRLAEYNPTTGEHVLLVTVAGRRVRIQISVA